jgi:hypothetical protein
MFDYFIAFSHARFNVESNLFRPSIANQVDRKFFLFEYKLPCDLHLHFRRIELD